MPESPDAIYRKLGDMSPAIPATQEPPQKSAVVDVQALEVALGACKTRKDHLKEAVTGVPKMRKPCHATQTNL